MDRDEHWLLDATASEPPDILGWVPYDPDTGDVTIGLLIVTSGFDAPHDGRFSGVYHPDGQEACEAWCEVHADVIEQLIAARGLRSGQATA